MPASTTHSSTSLICLEGECLGSRAIKFNEHQTGCVQLYCLLVSLYPVLYWRHLHCTNRLLHDYLSCECDITTMINPHSWCISCWTLIFARQSEDITKEPMHSHLEQVFREFIITFILFLVEKPLSESQEAWRWRLIVMSPRLMLLCWQLRMSPRGANSSELQLFTSNWELLEVTGMSHEIAFVLHKY